MIQSIMVNYKLNDDIHNPRYISDGMNELERNMKRILDFVVALVCLVIFSPLFLVCYIAVKREDGGPAIFKQERIGRFGRPFYIYKFRSMQLDAEKDGPALYQHDPRYRYLYQIRPGVTSYATLYNGYTDTMEKMLRRLDLDLYYLEHRSWWFDFKILVKTFINIVFGKKF